MIDSPYGALLVSAETGIYNILEIEDELIKLKTTNFLVTYLQTIITLAEADRDRKQNNAADIIMVTEKFLDNPANGGLGQFLDPGAFYFLKEIFLDIVEFVYTDVNNTQNADDSDYYFNLGHSLNKQLEELQQQRERLTRLLNL